MGPPSEIQVPASLGQWRLYPLLFSSPPSTFSDTLMFPICEAQTYNGCTWFLCLCGGGQTVAVSLPALLLWLRLASKWAPCHRTGEPSSEPSWVSEASYPQTSRPLSASSNLTSDNLIGLQILKKSQMLQV